MTSRPTNIFFKKAANHSSSIQSTSQSPTTLNRIQTRNIFSGTSSFRTIPLQSITESTFAFSSQALPTKSNDKSKKNKALTSILVKKSNKPNTGSELKRIKFKIHTIMKTNPIHQCFSFNNKNDRYNTKVLDYLGSKYYHERQKSYQTKFRFDKNDLGEAHNRLSMIMKFKPLNSQTFNPIEQIGSMLTEEEKNLVLLDPNYFFKEKQYNNYDSLKGRSLSQTLQNEEKINMNNFRDLKNLRQFSSFSSSRVKEPDYTFKMHYIFKEHEIQEKQKDIEKYTKRVLRKDHDERLAQLKNKKKSTSEMINCDVTDMIRSINRIKNKDIKYKSLFKKKTADEEDDDKEQPYKDSRSKLILKNFIRLRNEEKKLSKRIMNRNQHIDEVNHIRNYKTEIEHFYISQR